MTKAAAFYQFFSGFGIPAYEENSIYYTAREIAYPYITYELKTDSWNDAQAIPVSASLWYRSADPSLVPINAKTEEISNAIPLSGKRIFVDDGIMLFRKGSPFAQTMGQDSDDLVKRKVLSFTVIFYTN